MGCNEIEQNRISSTGDVFDREARIFTVAGHVARKLSERPALIHFIGQDFAFDNHLRFSRHINDPRV